VRTEDGYIINKCLNGEATAFGLLVDKYKEGVYALAYSKLRNFHDAEDVAQEVFIKAYKKLRTLRRWDNFMAWIHAITSNLCKDWIRERSRRPDREFVEDQDPATLVYHSMDSYRESLVFKPLHEALDSLPKMHHQVLTLHYLGGMKIREIAGFLGTSPSTVARRLREARSQLKEEMLAMMETTIEQQKLRSGFTFRIVEVVKRTRIKPAPRMPWLPWGLSAATGVMLTIMSFSSNLISFNPLNLRPATLGEVKVVDTGEIFVDAFELPKMPLFSGKQGDNDLNRDKSEETQWVLVREGDLQTDFFNVCFFDDHLGWAVGFAGPGVRIAYTKDGGKNWTGQSSGIFHELYDIVFISKSEGWAVGGTGGLPGVSGSIILHTDDGGEHWTHQKSVAEKDLQSVFFVDEHEGWAVGNGGTILYTGNGGAHWVTQVCPTENDLKGVAFVNSEEGWAIGAGGVILRTTDGGTNWKTQNSSTVTDLAGLAFVNAKKGWIVGRSGTILTTDDGESWVAQDAPTRNDLHGVAFADENQGWAVGDNGIILHTADGGKSWIVHPSGVTNWLMGVSCAKGNVWAVGSMGVVLKYTSQTVGFGETGVVPRLRSATAWGQLKRS